ncbi:hypothetical protein ACFW5U_35590 [Streptomyces rochei]|uniref:hypothetical protein n=1 Tax=Streptomyces rochei TaxID=1928 RepID=UPI0036BA236B
MQYKHQSVRDFVAAMQRGDQAEAARIAHDISERHKRGTAAKGELSELSWANAATPLGRK